MLIAICTSYNQISSDPDQVYNTDAVCFKIESSMVINSKKLQENVYTAVEEGSQFRGLISQQEKFSMVKKLNPMEDS